MKRVRRGLWLGWFLACSIALFSCGGRDREEKLCPTCPVCTAPTPGPSLDDIRQQLVQLNIKKFAARLNLDFDRLQAAAVKFNVVDKFGRKEITAEDFPRLVNFLWEVDPEFRVQQLRAMAAVNRLVSLANIAERFYANVMMKDPAEDASQLISEVIVAQAQLQRLIEADLGELGIENVRGLRPTDELPAAQGMMQDLLTIVAPFQATPLPSPKPSAALRGDWSWLESSAQARTRSPIRDPIRDRPAAGPTAVLHPNPIVRMKINTAPLLLARVMTYEVAGKNFVLQSPWMAAQPQFVAIPVEQFHFKVEKQTVGPAYRDALDAKVQALAAKPQRDISDEWEGFHAIVELRLANQLVDYNKTAPESRPGSTPGATEKQVVPAESAPSSTQRPSAVVPADKMSPADGASGSK